MISNPQYVSPYDDLAFEMYVDKDVARIMRVMEAKKHQAVIGKSIFPNLLSFLLFTQTFFF